MPQMLAETCHLVLECQYKMQKTLPLQPLSNMRQFRIVHETAAADYEALCMQGAATHNANQAKKSETFGATRGSQLLASTMQLETS